MKKLTITQSYVGDAVYHCDYKDEDRYCEFSDEDAAFIEKAVSDYAKAQSMLKEAFDLRQVLIPAPVDYDPFSELVAKLNG